jgi:hypothetical protein
MRQKGGNLRLPGGEVLTAEQILDKHVGVFFNKNPIQISEEVVNTVRKYLNAFTPQQDTPENTKKTLVYNLFLKNADRQNKYALHPLNFDIIENLIYATTSPSGERNIDGEPIFKLDSPVYEFKIRVDADGIDAFRPVIKKERVAGQEYWKLYVTNQQTNELVPTPIKVDGRLSGKDAIFKITEFAKFKSKPQYLSGVQSPDGVVNIDTIEKNYLEQKIRNNEMADNLLFDIKPSGDNTFKYRVVYGEEVNRDEWKFHPHNFLNFLPKMDDQEKFKVLYTNIVDGMSKISSLCRKLANVPGAFYHIHVSLIPNEETILLTIHGLVEEFKARGTWDSILEKHTYKNSTGKKYKLERPEYPDSSINKGGNNPSTLIKKYQEYRNGHNAYILLKPNTNTHAIYTLSQLNQKGNYFIMNFDRALLGPVFALDQSAIGLTKYDINHINGKGVMITPTNEGCLLFCNETTGLLPGDFRSEILSLLPRLGVDSNTNRQEINNWIQTVQQFQERAPIAAAVLPQVGRRILRSAASLTEDEIQQMIEITGLLRNQAIEYLRRSGSVQNAITHFLNSGSQPNLYAPAVNPPANPPANPINEGAVAVLTGLGVSEANAREFLGTNPGLSRAVVANRYFFSRFGQGGKYKMKKRKTHTTRKSIQRKRKTLRRR